MLPANGRRGFTLIELVAVIAILAIIVTVAVPLFADLRTDAHRGTVAATAGSFESAVRLANTACLATGWAGKTNLPGYGDGLVDFAANCNPTDAGTKGGSTKTNLNVARCARVWDGIQAARPGIGKAAGCGEPWCATAKAGVCTYAYQDDASTTRQFTYGAATGAVVVTNP